MPDLGNLSTSGLFASIFWGGVGTGILVYGWKQKSPIPLGAGALMVGISYWFYDSALIMSVISVLILAVMYWLKRQGY
jgi:hypothetical protein